VLFVELIPVDDHTSEYYELDREFYGNLGI